MLVNINTLLKEETLDFYECLAIVKVKKEKTKLSNAYDELRAIPYVVTAQPKHEDMIEKRSNENYDYAQLKIKFLSYMDTPLESLNALKQVALFGFGDDKKYKVYGLVGLIIREDTIQLIEKQR